MFVEGTTDLVERCLDLCAYPQPVIDCRNKFDVVFGGRDDVGK